VWNTGERGCGGFNAMTRNVFDIGAYLSRHDGRVTG
jgi:hypothetical protein